MYVSPLILAARSRCGSWPTKVVGVAGYKSPIAFEDFCGATVYPSPVCSTA
jgi:hypothetical protein